MSDRIKEVLGLAGYEILNITEESDEEVGVDAEAPGEGACPHCGVFSGRVHQRSAKPSRILWGFLGLRRLVLRVRRKRFWCGECKRAFTQRLPGLMPRQRVGVEAQVTLLQHLAEHSFSWLSRALKVGYWAMRRILSRLPLPWYTLEDCAPGDGPIILGIDEHSFRGTDLVITVTMLSPQRQLLAILRDDRQQTLRAYLQSLPDPLRARIQAVCIDQKESYRSLLRKELPGADVVADHFHIIADANSRLDDTRRLEQAEGKHTISRWPFLKRPDRLSAKQLVVRDTVLAELPTLREHYFIKEQLRALYACRSLDEARLRWTSLLVIMEASDDANVLVWAKSLSRWRTEILAYFRWRATNGFTEGCHTKIKLLKRISYGYRNRDVYRAKMLLGFLPHTPAALRPHLTT
jgi:transposase